MKITVRAGVQSYDVEGLQPGQTVQVSAANALGAGPAASYTAPEPAEVPEAPEVSD